MAFKVAWRMFKLSISLSQMMPNPMLNALLSMIGFNFARCLAESCLESLIPSMDCCCRGKMTAAATTGPAKGPRPASSMPAMHRQPVLHSSRSQDSKSILSNFHLRIFLCNSAKLLFPILFLRKLLVILILILILILSPSNIYGLVGGSGRSVGIFSCFGSSPAP